MATAIIFDMTQTLQIFDFPKMQKEFHDIIKAIPAARKIPISRFMKAYFKNYDSYQAGKINNDWDFCKGIFSGLGISLGKKQTAFFIRNHLERRKKFMRLAPRMKETLHSLKRAGFKLGLLSNGVKNWVGFDWRFLGIKTKSFFAAEIYSQETGKTKPNPAMYRAILKKMKVKAHKAVFVGDNYAHDVIGPKKTGMKAVWLNKGGKKGKADFAIRNIAGLLKLKGTLARI